MHKLQLGVIYGSRSSEHEVSVISALQLMNACVAHGGAGWDHSGLVQALEIAANHKIAGN